MHVILCLRMIVIFHFVVFMTKYLVRTLSNSLTVKCKMSAGEAHCSGNENYSEDFCKQNVGSECICVDGKIKFNPPLYLQRYEAVLSVLQHSPWQESTKKVVDFGCSELRFFLYLKHLTVADEILEVDVDENTLERGLSRAAPLNSDYLFCKRETPMNVSIFSGSIAEYDECLLGTDAVVGIEVIEHLQPDVLDKVPENIFQNIRPKIAIFTTPNADFNVLLSNNNGFRHPDHKFEWTRKEFQRWAENITEKYPNYSVKFHGIGAGPEGSEDLGCCTQMAIFIKKFGLEDEMYIPESKATNKYKLLRKYEYPFYIDVRSNEEKILDEVLYRIKFTMNQTEYYNYEDCSTEIPLSYFMEYISQWCDSQETLKKILLEHNFCVNERGGCDFLLYYGPSDASYRSDDENSVEYSATDDCGKIDFVQECWDLEYGDGYCNGESEKLLDEESSSLRTENSKASLELCSMVHHGAVGDDNGSLPDKPSDVMPPLAGRECVPRECFDYDTLSKSQKKKFRNTLRNPSKNLVRSVSIQ